MSIIKAFSVIQDLKFHFEEYYYEVGGKDQDAWQRRLYHQPIEEKDIELFAEMFIESIIREIHRRIEFNSKIN